MSTKAKTKPEVKPVCCKPPCSKECAKPSKECKKPAVRLSTKVIKKPQEIDLKGLKIKRLVLREDGTLSIGYVK